MRFFAPAGFIVSSGGQRHDSLGGLDIKVIQSGLKVILKSKTKEWKAPSFACCEDAWYHIVLTWDSDITTVYINGSIVDQVTSRGSGSLFVYGHNTFVVGKPNWADERFGQFSIDEMWFMDELRNSSQILQIFNSYLQGKNYAMFKQYHSNIIFFEKMNSGLFLSFQMEILPLLFRMEFLEPASLWIHLLVMSARKMGQ